MVQSVPHGGKIMFCTNCGTSFEDGNAFCPNCGTPVAQPAAAPVAQPAPAPAPAPAPQPEAYGYAPQPQPQAVYAATAPVAGNPEEEKSCLTTGILAAAFSCTFFLSFLGLVFGPMGLGKCKKYQETYGSYPVKVRIGKYLSIGGLAFGGFMTLYLVIYLIAFIAGIFSAMR